MRVALSTLMLVLSVVLAGCSSYLDFRRPVVRNYAADLSYEAPAAATEAGSESGRPKRVAEALARLQAKVGKAEQDYAVGPGDALHLSVLVPTQAGSGISVDLRVGEDGDVSLPLVGKTRLVGLTVPAIQEKVAALYADGYYRDPVASVVVTEYASKRIFVTGSVAAPHVVVLKANRITLLEALLEAGGLTARAGRTARVTRAAGPGDAAGAGADFIEVDLDRLVEEPDLQQNVWVYPGDVVYVAPVRAEFFYVLGYVRAPGAYPLPADGPSLGIMDAIAFARGLHPAGRSDMTYLLRTTPEGRDVHRVDLTRVAAAKDPDVALQPGDTIIVGTSWGRRTLDGILHAVGLGRLVPASAY